MKIHYIDMNGMYSRYSVYSTLDTDNEYMIDIQNTWLNIDDVELEFELCDSDTSIEVLISRSSFLPFGTSF